MIELSFYDHIRQGYAKAVPPRVSGGEIMIGDYGKPGEDEGVGEGGEFAIVLHDLNERSKLLSPQLRVFHDATGSLARFIELGGLDVMAEVENSEELSKRLIELGLEDRSDTPLKETENNETA